MKKSRFPIVLGIFYVCFAYVGLSCTISNSEYQALNSLYNSTHGSYWTVDYGWNFPSTLSDPCSWQGVYCTPVADSSSTGCVISGLNLTSFNMSGTLPSNLGNLSNLTSLDLSVNHLFGEIPSLNGLNILNNLNLSFNSLSGSLGALGTLVEIQVIDVSRNLITGGIPDLNSLTKLVSFSATNNNLFSPVLAVMKSFRNITTLQYLSLHHNSLFGILPQTLKPFSLKYLDLSSNNIGGGLSFRDLWQSSNLVYLSLRKNRLNGTLPFALFALPQLQYLILNDNLIHGTLFINSSSTVSHLVLHNNSLRASLPEEIGLLRNLTVLSISCNQFSGSLPKNLTLLSKLTSFNASQNKFVGQLSDIFSNRNFFPKLSYLDLANNAFTGDVPIQLFQMPALQSLFLFSNCFGGNFPIVDAISSLQPSLKYVSLSYLTSAPSCVDQIKVKYLTTGALAQHMMLHSTIPSFVWNSSSLTSFHAAGLGLQGYISELSSSSALRYVDVSHNYLTGSLPMSVQTYGQFSAFQAGYNFLSGDISGSNFTNSSEVSVQYNRISGPQPVLPIADVTNNVLTGNLFDCESPVAQLSSTGYSCGSEVLNAAYFTWTSIFFMTVAVAAVSLYYLQQRDIDTTRVAVLKLEDLLPTLDPKSSYYWALDLYRQILTWSYFDFSSTVADLHNTQQFLRVLYLAGWASFWMSFSYCIICTTTYVTIKKGDHHTYVTYHDQYGWIITSAHMKGILPVVFILLFILGSYVYISRKMSELGYQASITGAGAVASSAARKSLAAAMVRSSVVNGRESMVNARETMGVGRASVVGGRDSMINRETMGAGRKSMAQTTRDSTLANGRDTMTPTALSRKSMAARDSTIGIGRKSSAAPMESSISNGGGNSGDSGLGQGGSRDSTVGRKSMFGWTRDSMLIADIMQSNSLFNHPATSQDNNDPSTSTKEETLSCSQQVCQFLAVFMVQIINLGVAIVVNTSYVSFLKSGDGKGDEIIVGLVQIGMSLFKVAWNGVYVIQSLNWLSFMPSSSLMMGQVFMYLVNFILAPTIAVILADANCFYYAFQAMPIQHSEFEYLKYSVDTCTLTQSPIGSPTSSFTLACSSSASIALMSDSQSPPFLYSYGCGSAVLTDFVPVLLYAFCINAILLPLFRVVLMLVPFKWWRGHLPDLLVTQVVSRLVVEEESRDSAASSVECGVTEQGVELFNAGPSAILRSVSKIALVTPPPKGAFDASVVIAKRLLDSAILMTFGIACPVLGLGIAICVLANTLLWKIVIGRYLCLSGSNNELACMRLEVATADVAHGIVGSMWIVVSCVSIFWCINLFDMTGEEYGFIGGTITLVVTAAVIPLTAFVLVLIVDSQEKNVKKVVMKLRDSVIHTQASAVQAMRSSMAAARGSVVGRGSVVARNTMFGRNSVHNQNNDGPQVGLGAPLMNPNLYTFRDSDGGSGADDGSLQNAHELTATCYSSSSMAMGDSSSAGRMSTINRQSLILSANQSPAVAGSPAANPMTEGVVIDRYYTNASSHAAQSYSSPPTAARKMTGVPVEEPDRNMSDDFVSSSPRFFIPFSRPSPQQQPASKVVSPQGQSAAGAIVVSEDRDEPVSRVPFGGIKSQKSSVSFAVQASEPAPRYVLSEAKELKAKEDREQDVVDAGPSAVASSPLVSGTLPLFDDHVASLNEKPIAKVSSRSSVLQTSSVSGATSRASSSTSSAKSSKLFDDEVSRSSGGSFGSTALRHLQLLEVVEGALADGPPDSSSGGTSDASGAPVTEAVSNDAARAVVDSEAE